ncbi:MAG TPA: Scr1 family TA system antitoxin-like transcriptional regulator [Trebonia sp.]
MDDDAYGATVAKRRLARRLSELRGNTGYTANHVCDILNWGRGKVGRFEANQWKRPEMSDIRDLVRIYEVEGKEREEVEALAVRCRVRPWWRDYGEIFDNEFPGYENDATSIRCYMPLVLPGLLQTPVYANALFKTGPRSPKWRQRAVEARLRRQQILDRADGTAPYFSAVITEASLLFRWGMHEDRRELTEHLAEMSTRRNVELRVQRFDDGPPTSICSMVNIFGFPDGEPPLVFAETDYAIEEVSKPESVNGYIQSFEQACDAALEPGDTTVYLEKLAKRMELPMTDLSQAIWRKATLSAHNGGCVEVAANLRGVTAVRDSKRLEGGAHVVDRASFAAFLADARQGRFDL